MLDKPPREWANIKTTSGQRLAFAGIVLLSYPCCPYKPFRLLKWWSILKAGSFVVVGFVDRKLILGCRQFSSSFVIHS